MTDTLARQERHYIVIAALLALFLGALDALVMSAAMPTIVAELGGMHLYSWVYSAYFLARAVSLPVFGKLADLFSARRIFLFSITLFLLASAAAGAAPSMVFLVGARVFQGIGAGGIFALVDIVLSDISLPGERGKTLSFASSVWGISSIVGPTLGGFIVTYMSWRWIFFINLPIAVLCLAGIGLFLQDKRERNKEVHLDIAGIVCLTGFILSFFAIFSLFAYAPLFIQGALAKTPMQVGMAMLSLSLGWSCGSLVLGRFVDGAGGRTA
ncbi:MAG: hypothetical protein ACD_75C01600G0001, partial [uncultured bacterium]